jgi:hypothetical protein
MSRDLRKLTILVSLLVLSSFSTFFSTPAFAQSDAGSIVGTIRDATGALVSGANIKAKSLATGVERTAVSANAGQYNIPGLTPDKYEVTISNANFKTFKSTVEVTVGSTTTVDAQLEVGQASMIVEVSVASAGTEVNTQTQELSQLIDTQQLAQLPSLTRNPYDFVAVSGNVSNGDNTTNSANSGQEISSRGVGYAINGQRESGTEILLDGVENVAVFGVSVGEDVPIDAVQEYNIITNNFSPEYGRASGGVVNVTTKSGTNNFHGSAWEYNRLSTYTANTYANDAQNSAFLAGGGTGALPDPKGAYTRNQFGFQAGGPIIKNKLFIFESTEWTRVRSSATETEETLDPSFVSMLPANAQSYFSSFGTGALPASGAVTTAGQLAAAGLTVGPINRTTLVAASQPVFDIVNFQVPFDDGGGLPQNTYALVGRLDYNLSDKTQMFFRAGRENIFDFAGTAFYSVYPQYDAGGSSVNQSYLFSLNHVFSGSLFNNTKLSFTRFNSITSFNTALTNTPNVMIVPPTDPVTNGLIQLPGLENYGAPGAGGLPYGGPQNTIQLEHDLSWTKGKHNMRFGGQFTYIQLNVAYGAYAQAVEQLGSTLGDSLNDLTNVAGNAGGSQLTTFSARINPNGALPCTLNAWGEFIGTTSTGTNGCPASSTVVPPLSSASYGRSYRYKDWAVYAQDSFRVKPRLTLNYGLRYEHYGVQHNNNPNLDSNFYFGSGNGIEQQTANGGVSIADKSSVGQFWAPRWGTLAPRVGFAYDVFGDAKTSLRGGFGISYERNFGNVTYNASFNPPASAVLNDNCAPSDPGCEFLVTNNDLGPLGVAGPATNLPPAELRMPQPNINVAQTQFWSLAIQHEITHNTIFELGYSGAHGIHLYDIENINQVGAAQAFLGQPLITTPDPATGATCPYVSYEGSYNNINAAPSPECLTRPNNQYAAINMRGSLGGSSYNALNAKIQTQNLHHSGLSVVANYTWSHSLDDISSTFSDSLQGGSGYIGSLGYTNPFQPKLDWGSSDYDVRQRLVASPIWETPWFKSGKGVTRQALGGWSLVGIFTARTGIPFNVYDENNLEIGYTVPRLTPGAPITDYHVGSPQAVGPNEFNALTVPIPESFAPLNSTLGISDLGPFPANMVHRNAFRAPGAWNADMAVAKSFRVTERVGMEFRAEGFDVFNHHNYYVNATDLYYDGLVPNSTQTALVNPAPLTVTELKGGLGSLATGGNHDERRFGQFSLRVSF